MGGLDKFLEVGSSMDGLTPLLSLAGQARGSSCIVNVPLGLMVEIEQALRAEGFALLRPAIDGDRFIFDVPKTQHKYVLGLLRREFGLE